jgi:hypothetical protein
MLRPFQHLRHLIRGVLGSGLQLQHPWSIDFKNARDLLDVCGNTNEQFMLDIYPDCQVLSFRGSEVTSDWLHDFTFLKSSYRGMGQVHIGFSETYEGVRTRVMDRLDKDKTLVITGHSLGGAVATLAALDLKGQGYKVHSLYAFGCPRVGDEEFKKVYGNAGIPTFRFVNAFDIVPRIPTIGYVHVGLPLFLSDKGELLEKQEPLSNSEISLWIEERITSHYIPNYRVNLVKYMSSQI